jgi:cysteinyl-tRNA synthetase
VNDRPQAEETGFVPLTLYNTRTRTKEEFRPLDPSHVRMYVCGPTVYDYAHIGNARPMIVFDVVYRLLKYLAAKGEWDGGRGKTKVTYARNITDVDDKINARAIELYPDMPPEQAIRRLTEETTAQFHKDVAALGALPPTYEPRATDYIEQMKDMITRLYEADIAYVADDHVLFSVAAYDRRNDVPRYGSLARRSLDEMIAGARVEVAPYKRDPVDFVLWKPSKPGEPAWPSPLGIGALGRPGWHLECSAMAKALLGEEFDIHGGGIDLVFPHHENEVAQSTGANHTPIMANFWMHNGFLQVEGEKMSKSLGNFFTINELLQKAPRWPGAVMRLNMLRTHYRQPLDWTENGFFESYGILEHWRRLLDEAMPSEPSVKVIEALVDDLNTPKALAELHSLADKAGSRSGGTPIEAADELAATLNLLGFEDYIRDVTKDAKELRAGGRKKIEAAWNEAEAREAGIDTNLIRQQVSARLAARKAKNWAQADRIRDQLAAMGIILKDAKNPETGEIETTWEIAR